MLGKRLQIYAVAFSFPFTPPVMDAQQEAGPNVAQPFKGGGKMLLKQCRGCGRIIPQTMKLCDVCEKRQQDTPSRHTIYNDTRRDPRAAAFYLSKEWKVMRRCIISVYDNIDIYALYMHHEIMTCDQVHHIEELEEAWERRLDPMNLIPLNQRTHNTITAMYKKGKNSMRETQKQIRELIDRHFKEAGGYEKVLSDAKLVAPPP